MTEMPRRSVQNYNNGDKRKSLEMWREFTEDTTLHGIRYVFMKRHFVIRLIWFVLLLASGGYYLFLVYSAFDKFYSRPITTVINTTRLNKMVFPAITICPLNLFAKSKLFMRDDDPLFTSTGLNISSCAVTAEVRGDRPCGLAMLCCCAPSEYSQYISLIPNCTNQYKQDIWNTMNRAGHHPDVESFYRYYSQNITDLLGPICTFGWAKSPCSATEFSPLVTAWGMCYTFNSADTGTEIKTVDYGGLSSGLRILLDAQTHEYFLGKLSVGFKVLVHGQGEYIDEWEGINVGPGQHVGIALSEKRVGFLHYTRGSFYCVNTGTISRVYFAMLLSVAHLKSPSTLVRLTQVKIV